MKKAVVLMLILAMCLSMGACGKANSANPTDDPTNDPDHPETIPAMLLPALEVLYGEWHLTTETDAPNNPYTKLVVNENGTCFADGKEYTWKIDYEYSNEKNLFI